MNRLLVFIGLLFFVGNLSAKERGSLQKALNNEWVGPIGEYIAISNDSAYFSPITGKYNYKYPIRVDGDKLTLVGANGADYQVYKVETFNDGTLGLKAENQNAYDFTKTWEPVVFVTRQSQVTRPFSFQKIYFGREGSGMVVADYMHVQFEVDAAGNLLFSCIPGHGKLSGTYKGVLSGAQLQELIRLIKGAAIERFDSRKGHWSDVPGHYFRFYYNDKVKEVDGQMLPVLSYGIMAFLESLPATVQLEKISDKYGLEKLAVK